MYGESDREVPLPLFKNLKTICLMTRKHLLFILALLCGQVSFAQLIGFETGIPKQFQTSDKGKITLSTQYYKEGKQSHDCNRNESFY